MSHLAVSLTRTEVKIENMEMEKNRYLNKTRSISPADTERYDRSALNTPQWGEEACLLMET